MRPAEEECEACEKEFANLQTRSPVANRATESEREGGDPTFLLSLALHTPAASEGREGRVKQSR